MSAVKKSAEDPCERWNFYVQHAAPEQLAALNGVQLFCRKATQALNQRQMVGEGQVKVDINHKVKEKPSTPRAEPSSLGAPPDYVVYSWPLPRSRTGCFGLWIQ